MWLRILKALKARGYTGAETLEEVQKYANDNKIEFKDASGDPVDLAKAFGETNTTTLTLDAEAEPETDAKSGVLVDAAELKRLQAADLAEKQRKAAARHSAITKDIHDAQGGGDESEWRKSLGTPETFRIRQEKKAYNAKTYGAKGMVPADRSPNRAFLDYDQAVAFSAWFKCNVLGKFNVASPDEKALWADLSQKTAITTTNTLGGALVPDIFVPQMIDLKESYGAARQWLGVTPMVNQKEIRPRRTGGYTVATAAEAATLTASDLGFNNVELDAKKLYALGQMSSEMLRYSSVNFGDTAANEISYAFANKEDDIVFNGDGTATYFGWTGFRVALKNVYSTTAGVGQSLATGNLFSEYAMADFTAAFGLLPKYAESGNVAWVTHKAADAQTMMRLQASAGGVTGGELSAGYANRRFLNYNILHAQIMPSTDANSQIAHLYGAGNLAAKFGEVTGSMRIDLSEHVGFLSDTIYIRGCEEIAFTLHDPGTSTVAGPVISIISASA